MLSVGVGHVCFVYLARMIIECKADESLVLKKERRTLDGGQDTTEVLQLRETSCPPVRISAESVCHCVESEKKQSDLLCFVPCLSQNQACACGYVC
jgi:hypothetical protein